jgi:hypothetical protein
MGKYKKRVGGTFGCSLIRYMILSDQSCVNVKKDENIHSRWSFMRYLNHVFT